MIDVTTRNKFDLKPKFEDAKTLGIKRNITKGLTIPPVKYIKIPSCKMSIKRKISADLSES